MAFYSNCKNFLTKYQFDDEWYQLILKRGEKDVKGKDKNAK